MNDTAPDHPEHSLGMVTKPLADALRALVQLEADGRAVCESAIECWEAARAALAAYQQAEAEKSTHQPDVSKSAAGIDATACIFPACQHNGCREQCQHAEQQPAESSQLAYDIWVAACAGPGDDIESRIGRIQEILDAAAPRQAEAQPVAWQSIGGSIWGHKTSPDDRPLYATPQPQQAPRELTDSELDALMPEPELWPGYPIYTPSTVRTAMRAAIKAGPDTAQGCAEPAGKED